MLDAAVRCRLHPFLWLLCITLLVSSTGAQDVEVDPSLPSYRAVAGVVGVIRGHGSGVIRGQRSSGMGVLMTVWSEGFQRIYPSARVELDDAPVDGAGGGAATFGPSLGIMREPTIRRFKRRFGYAATQLPVGFYVLAVYVHKDNPYREGLGMEEVNKIFSVQFWDMTWGDLGCRGVWFNRSIRLYALPRYPASALLKRHYGLVFGFKDSVKRYAAVVNSVARDTRGMGLAWLGVAGKDKVRALAIAPVGSSKFVHATSDNVCNGSYPLTGKFYLKLNHDLQAGFELDRLRREFLRYILSREGQQTVIKVGYGPLSAELAKEALGQVGLTPSGEGSWDRMIRRLRARRLSREHVDRIERMARWVGDQPTHERLVALAYVLALTKLTSSVTFATDEEGATIKYRHISRPGDVQTYDPTHKAKATIPVGLYYVWTEREGKATSPTDAWFQIIRENERLKIYESR